MNGEKALGDSEEAECWRRLKLVLEYEGTAYSGFQSQVNAPSIQNEVELAIAQLTGEKVRVTGAGRTDAGVHALGQVVSFRTHSRLPVETFVKALNFYLPEDIAIASAQDMPHAFNARRLAVSREYEYTILNRRSPSPFWRRFSYHVPVALDVGRMREASRLLIGQHDFAAFAGASADRAGTTVRRIEEFEIKQLGDLLKLRVVGNAFLPHQVRNIVGTLLWVGLGRLDIDGLQQILGQRDRRRAGPAVPAQGLCLVKVNY